MKKKVMRIVAVIGIITMMVGFAGCEKKTKCEWCGKKRVCQMVHLSLLGDYSMCEECESYVTPMSDRFKTMEELQ